MDRFVGVDELLNRLAALTPKLVDLEATGGFETVVAAALAAACRSRSSARHRSARSLMAR